MLFSYRAHLGSRFMHMVGGRLRLLPADDEQTQNWGWGISSQSRWADDAHLIPTNLVIRYFSVVFFFLISRTKVIMSGVILITDWLMPMLFISQRAGQMGQLPHGPVADCQTHGKEWKHTWYSTPVLHRQMSSSRSSGTGLSVSDQATHTEQRQGKCVELEQDPLGIEYEWLIGGRLFSILVIKYFITDGESHPRWFCQ